MKSVRYNVSGMTCAACEANVARAVNKIDGVSKAEVNLLARSMLVEYDEEKTNDAAIISAVQRAGYGASLPESGKQKSGFRGQWETRQKAADDERAAMKRRLTSSIWLLLPLMYLAMGKMLGLPLPAVLAGVGSDVVSAAQSIFSALIQLLLASFIIIINRHFFTAGFKALLHRSPNMDSLVAIGSGAALVYGVLAIVFMLSGFTSGALESVFHYSHQLYFESSAMILTLVTVGKYLEARSKAKTSGALGKLIDLAPKFAAVLRNGEEITIPADELKAGDVVIIRPGDSIPADGEVTEGHGYVDQSAITGESVPVEVSLGSTVISATTNKNGSFRFVASRVGEDTTLAGIIRLVDEAGSSKAPIARLADRISAVFVPTVIGIALVTAAVWLVTGGDGEFALARAISVLVISCPCALGLATPVAIMVGTGRAAEQGILIRSATSLESLHAVDTIVLDKTGTVTTGRPAVTDIISDMEQTEFLRLAAALESGSEHPLAEAVTAKAKELSLALPTASDFEAHSGRGVSAIVGDRKMLGGNAAFMAENGIDISAFSANDLASLGKTPLYFAADGKAIGLIAVADGIKPDSAAAIARLREMGRDVIMLTGDNRRTAEAIAAGLPLSQVIADVMPADKEAYIRELQEQGKNVAMVGDGINDAPALTRANVGIAIGAGADIAIESADVVLMKDSLSDVANAIELSTAVIKNIRMNLFWAFFYNVLGIPVAAGVLYPAFHIALSPMIGAAAMSLSSVCVVTNALRLRFFRPKGQRGEAEQTTEQITERKGIPMKKILNIEGMMCAHCKAHVEKALAGVAGVSRSEADLENNTATVWLDTDVSDETLIDAVADAGYAATGCRRE